MGPLSGFFFRCGIEGMAPWSAGSQGDCLRAIKHPPCDFKRRQRGRGAETPREPRIVTASLAHSNDRESHSVWPTCLRLGGPSRPEGLTYQPESSARDFVSTWSPVDGRGCPFLALACSSSHEAYACATSSRVGGVYSFISLLYRAGTSRGGCFQIYAFPPNPIRDYLVASFYACMSWKTECIIQEINYYSPLFCF